MVSAPKCLPLREEARWDMLIWSPSTPSRGNARPAISRRTPALHLLEQMRKVAAHRQRLGAPLELEVGLVAQSAHHAGDGA